VYGGGGVCLSVCVCVCVCVCVYVFSSVSTTPNLQLHTAASRAEGNRRMMNSYRGGSRTAGRRSFVGTMAPGASLHSPDDEWDDSKGLV
jgi:hypothetical protein